MAATSRLAVSYGTFSCVLEGFDDPFEVMGQVVSFFKDISQTDPAFGGADTLDGLDALRDRFAVTHPDIDIDLEPLAGGVLMRRLVTDDAAALPPADAPGGTVAPSVDAPDTSLSDTSLSDGGLAPEIAAKLASYAADQAETAPAAESTEPKPAPASDPAPEPVEEPPMSDLSSWVRSLRSPRHATTPTPPQSDNQQSVDGPAPEDRTGLEQSVAELSDSAGDQAGATWAEAETPDIQAADADLSLDAGPGAPDGGDDLAALDALAGTPSETDLSDLGALDGPADGDQDPLVAAETPLDDGADELVDDTTDPTEDDGEDASRAPEPAPAGAFFGRFFNNASGTPTPPRPDALGAAKPQGMDFAATFQADPPAPDASEYAEPAVPPSADEDAAGTGLSAGEDPARDVHDTAENDPFADDTQSDDAPSETPTDPVDLAVSDAGTADPFVDADADADTPTPEESEPQRPARPDFFARLERHLGPDPEPEPESPAETADRDTDAPSAEDTAPEEDDALAVAVADAIASVEDSMDPLPPTDTPDDPDDAVNGDDPAPLRLDPAPATPAAQPMRLGAAPEPMRLGGASTPPSPLRLDGGADTRPDEDEAPAGGFVDRLTSNRDMDHAEPPENSPFRLGAPMTPHGHPEDDAPLNLGDDLDATDEEAPAARRGLGLRIPGLGRKANADPQGDPDPAGPVADNPASPEDMRNRLQLVQPGDTPAPQADHAPTADPDPSTDSPAAARSGRGLLGGLLGGRKPADMPDTDDAPAPAAEPPQHATPAARPDASAPKAANKADPETESMRTRLNSSFSSMPEPVAVNKMAFDMGPDDGDDLSARATARKLGAESVQDLMTASAAHLMLIEGHDSVSRADILSLAQELAGDVPLTAEAKVKAFGKLTRNGNLIRVEGGRFLLSGAAVEEIQDRLNVNYG